MGELVVGVDAGGTKTAALVADRAGRVLGFGTAGPGNWESVGMDGMLAALGRAVTGALASAGASRRAVVASGFGLAGLDWPRDHPVLDRAIARLGLPGPRVLANDAFVALRAGCREPYGLVSNAGTGTVTAGRNRAGETFRTMAIGFGEHGGAGELVRDALDAVAAYHHRVGPPTALEGAILGAVRVSTVDALFERLSRDELDLDASLAPLVVSVAADGDAVARELLTTMGRDLGRAVAGVASRLAMTEDRFELVTTGGLHGARAPWLEAAFLERVRAGCPGAEVVPLTVPPAVGAALLALGAVGPVDAGLHDRLAEAAAGVGVAS